MFTIGEYAMRAMVYGYREMRANGILPSGQTGGTVLTYAQNVELQRSINVELAHMIGRTPNFAMHVVPMIQNLAFAIAMTEQFAIGSDMYCAWRDYEIELHTRAIHANK